MNLGHPRFANPEQARHAAYHLSHKTSTRRAPIISPMAEASNTQPVPVSPCWPSLASDRPVCILGSLNRTIVVAHCYELTATSEIATRTIFLIL
jgi:hypothetical protein